METCVLADGMFMQNNALTASSSGAISSFVIKEFWRECKIEHVCNQSCVKIFPYGFKFTSFTWRVELMRQSRHSKIALLASEMESEMAKLFRTGKNAGDCVGSLNRFIVVLFYANQLVASLLQHLQVRKKLQLGENIVLRIRTATCQLF